MSLRGYPLFVFTRLIAEAVSRTEDASGAAGGGFHVLRAPENASRTREGCFAHRISLPYRKRLFFTPNASENASRTPGGLFEHRMRIPYRRRAFPVPSAFEGVGKGSAGDKFRVSGRRRKRWKGPERTKRAESSLKGKLLPLRNFELHNRGELGTFTR